MTGVIGSTSDQTLRFWTASVGAKIGSATVGKV
jgi:hypothetical protein